VGVVPAARAHHGPLSAAPRARGGGPGSPPQA
jgi:hypothetical protein